MARCESAAEEKGLALAVAGTGESRLELITQMHVIAENAFVRHAAMVLFHVCRAGSCMVATSQSARCGSRAVCACGLMCCGLPHVVLYICAAHSLHHRHPSSLSSHDSCMTPNQQTIQPTNQPNDKPASHTPSSQPIQPTRQPTKPTPNETNNQVI